MFENELCRCHDAQSNFVGGPRRKQLKTSRFHEQNVYAYVRTIFCHSRLMIFISSEYLLIIFDSFMITEIDNIKILMVYNYLTVNKLKSKEFALFLAIF